MRPDMKSCLLLFAGLIGCSAAPKTEPKTGPTTDSQVEGASVAEQKMCSEQAKKNFNDSAFSDDKSATYTNHYNSKTKTCYEEIATRSQLLPHAQAPSSYNLLVLDAFENRTYGEFSITYSGMVGTEWRPERVNTCRTMPRGQNQIDCKTTEEFDALVLRYFGTVPD